MPASGKSNVRLSQRHTPSPTVCDPKPPICVPVFWYGNGRPSGIEKRSVKAAGSEQVFVAEQPAAQSELEPVWETVIERLPPLVERVTALPDDEHRSAPVPSRTHAVPDGRSPLISMQYDEHCGDPAGRHRARA